MIINFSDADIGLAIRCINAAQRILDETEKDAILNADDKDLDRLIERLESAAPVSRKI